MSGDNVPDSVGHDSIETDDTDGGFAPADRRTFLKGIGAAGAATATGTYGIATQTRNAQALGPLAIPFGISASKAIFATTTGLAGYLTVTETPNLIDKLFGGDDPAQAATESTETAELENQRYNMGSVYAQTKEKIMNMEENYGGSLTSPTSKSNTRNSIRTLTLDTIARSYMNGQSESQALDNVRSELRDYLASVEKRVIDIYDWFAFSQWRQIHRMYQRVTALDDTSQSTFLNSRSTFDLSIYDPYDPDADDNISLQDFAPRGEYTMANGATMEFIPAVSYYTGDNTYRDRGLVLTVPYLYHDGNDDAYTSVVRDADSYATLTVNGNTYDTGNVADNLSNAASDLFNEVGSDSLDTRPSQNQFLYHVLDTSFDNVETDDPNVDTDSVGSTHSVLGLLQNAMETAERNVDAELDEMNTGGYLNDLWTAMDDGRIEPQEIMSRESFTSTTSVESITTSDKMYFGMDWNAETVEATINRDDGSTQSVSGALNLAIDNYINKAGVDSDETPNLPSDSDILNQIRDSIDSDTTIEVTVWIDYVDSDGNQKTDTYETSSDVSPDNDYGLGLGYDHTDLDVSSVNSAQIRVDKIGDGMRVNRRVYSDDTVAVNTSFSLGDEFNGADVVARQAQFMAVSDGESRTFNVRDGESVVVDTINNEAGDGTLDYLDYDVWIEPSTDPEQEYRDRVDKSTEINKTVDVINEYYGQNGNLGSIGDEIENVTDQVGSIIDSVAQLALYGAGAGLVAFIVSLLAGGSGGSGGSGSATQYRGK